MTRLSERGREERLELAEVVEHALAAGLEQAVAVAGRAMTPPDEAEDAEAGGPGGADAGEAVLDRDAVLDRRPHPAGGVDEDVGRGLAVGHERRADEAGVEPAVEPDGLEAEPQLVRVAAGRHADGDA